MASGTGWLRRAWRALLPAAKDGGPTFAIACRCGKVLRGRRIATHQVQRCPGCGRSVFVLPCGAFQPSAPEPDRAAPPPGRRYRPALWLLVPILVCGLLAMVAVYSVVRWLQQPGTAPVANEADTPRSRLLALIEQGRQELSDPGGLHLGRETLDRAVRLRDADPGLLDESEHRRLNQLQRQVALLAERVPVKLPDLLDQAEQAGNPAAWQARFRAEYQGRGLVLDDTLRTDRDGRVVGRRFGDVRGRQAIGRVALEDLTLVQNLPLRMPQRWVLGARLKSVEREGGPDWVIRLEPDSGVLFSERGVLEAAVPGLANDPEWPLLLARQQALLESLPAPRAHRP